MVLTSCGRRRRRWWCPRCGHERYENGHRCTSCKRIVCCLCTDHLDACCSTNNDEPGQKLLDECPAVDPGPIPT